MKTIRIKDHNELFQEKEYQDQLQEKQKALSDAKEDMQNMQEDARKSGVPSSITDRDQTQKSQTN